MVIMRRLIILASTFCLSIIVLLCILFNNNEIENLPFSELPELDIPIFGTDTIYSFENDPTIENTVVLFFSPDCSYCEEEISGIIKSGYSSEHTRWIFITNPMSKDEMPFFLERVPIFKINGSIILLDSSLRYHSLFGVAAPPSTFVYNEKGRLVFYTGQSVNPQELIKYLKK